MQEVVCETIVWTKFGVPLVRQTSQNGFPKMPFPKMLPQNDTFELLSLESSNSQCRKLFVRQLVRPNLEVFWQEQLPK